MTHLNLISRRSFLTQSFKTGMAVALSTLVDIPFVLKRALAEGSIGLNGKKVLFIWLRFGNDSLNTVVPVQDSAYYNMGTEASPVSTRATIAIPKDTAPGAGYDAQGPCFDATQFADVGGTARAAAQATYSYAQAIALGNGFAALHPSLKFLSPVYNAGHLAVFHRVGYPKQSRSHFDSQNYWENGTPNNNLIKDGIFYRTLIQSGLANQNPLTGVSIQSSLPLILRGSDAAMTNLSDVNRYKLLGVPGVVGLDKSEGALGAASPYPFVDKKSRELLKLQYQNLLDTLPLFENIASQMATNFDDDVSTDNDFPYSLFPISNETNGGYTRPLGGVDASKYVVDTSAYNTSGTGFFNNLKAAALVLNKTDAIIAGTEFGGFDTHTNQGGVTGAHANLLRRLGWTMYALRKYFTRYADRVNWNNLIVVTLSEFGRTTVENSDRGTDHAEAGVMLVAGGGIKGYDGAGRSGVFGCHLSDSVPWIPGPANQGSPSLDGSMFGVSDRYLKRAIDYRAVLGKIIRQHLGATQNQLDWIIPGYPTEQLAVQRRSPIDNTEVMGEPDFLA